MLGSAIPRRWVFSIALVGLVTIFAVSYSAVWSSPANADSQGVGGTGNSSLAVKTAAQTLVSAQTLPTGLVLAPGKQVQVTLNLIDGTGAVNNNLDSSVTILWTTKSGGLSVVAGSTARTAVLQANSTGTVEAVITQVQKTQTWVVKREIKVTVTTPAATPTAAAAPTNPGTPPATIPNAKGVVQPAASLLVSSTGVESGSSAESRSLNDRAVIFIQSGSVTDFFGVDVRSVDPTTLPPMPAGFTRGSSAADIKFYSAAGVVQTNFRLQRSAQVCLPTVSSDRANGFSNVRVMRLGSTNNQWIPLTTTFNNLTRQVCANSSNFSNFAVAVQQIPATTSPTGPVLPATGGWSPATNLLVLVGLLGIALVGGGTVTMLRARNASRPE